MTRGRKQLGRSETVRVDADTDAVTRDMNAVDQMHAQAKEIVQDQQARTTDDAVRLGMQLGAFQFARLQEKFLRAAQIRMFDEIRNSKRYKDLQIANPDGKVRAAQTIEEFCTHYIGASYRKLHQEFVALKTLGDEAYDIAQSLGLKRDLLRTVPALAADDQASVRELLTSGDHGPELAAAVESLIVRLGSEKAAAEKAKARLDQAIEAKDRLIRAKDEKLNELQMQLDQKASATLGEREAALIARLDEAAINAEASQRALLDVAVEAVSGGYSEATELRARNFVTYLAQQLVDASDQHSIVRDMDEVIQPITEAVIARCEAANGQATSPHTTN